ncbi:MAG: hypothetical protein D6683_07485 [Actinomyces sp.]|nr:MAG: hypothetical protein D6683_07485 [Actinomyces sp.]
MNPSVDGAGPVDGVDPVDEVREAAAEVLAGLRRLVAAVEHLVEDPESFSRVVESGRALVDAFLVGFGPIDVPDDPPAGGLESAPAASDGDGHAAGRGAP